MNVHMPYCLSGCSPDVNAYVISVRPELDVHGMPNLIDQLPHGCLLSLRQGEVIQHVPPRNDEYVSWIDRIGVPECNSEFIPQENLVGTNPFAEDTRRQVSRHRRPL